MHFVVSSSKRWCRMTSENRSRGVETEVSLFSTTLIAVVKSFIACTCTSVYDQCGCKTIWNAFYIFRRQRCSVSRLFYGAIHWSTVTTKIPKIVTLKSFCVFAILYFENKYTIFPLSLGAKLPYKCKLQYRYFRLFLFNLHIMQSPFSRLNCC